MKSLGILLVSFAAIYLGSWVVTLVILAARELAPYASMCYAWAIANPGLCFCAASALAGCWLVAVLVCYISNAGDI